MLLPSLLMVLPYAIIGSGCRASVSQSADPQLVPPWKEVREAQTKAVVCLSERSRVWFMVLAPMVRGK